MANPYHALLALLPDSPLLVGQVLSISGTSAVIELPDGGRLTARGSATVGQRVFVRAGLIEAEAPNLTPADIEI